MIVPAIAGLGQNDALRQPTLDGWAMPAERQRATLLPIHTTPRLFIPRKGRRLLADGERVYDMDCAPVSVSLEKKSLAGGVPASSCTGQTVLDRWVLIRRAPCGGLNLSEDVLAETRKINNPIWPSCQGTHYIFSDIFRTPSRMALSSSELPSLSSSHSDSVMMYPQAHSWTYDHHGSVCSTAASWTRRHCGQRIVSWWPPIRRGKLTSPTP